MSGNSALNFVASIFMLVIMGVIVFLSVSLVFDNQIESVLPLIGVVLVVLVAIFVWNRLKKKL